MQLGHRSRKHVTSTSVAAHAPDAAEDSATTGLLASSPSPAEASPEPKRRAHPTLTFTLEDANDGKDSWQSWDDAATTSPNAIETIATPQPTAVRHSSQEVDEEKGEARPQRATGAETAEPAPRQALMPSLEFDAVPVVTESDRHERFRKLNRDAFTMKVICVLTFIMAFVWPFVSSKPAVWWLCLMALIAPLGFWAAHTLDKRLVVIYFLVTPVHAVLQCIMFFQIRQQLDPLLQTLLFLVIALHIMFIPFISNFKDEVPSNGRADPLVQLFTSTEDEL